MLIDSNSKRGTDHSAPYGDANTKNDPAASLTLIAFLLALIFLWVYREDVIARREAKAIREAKAVVAMVELSRKEAPNNIYQEIPSITMLSSQKRDT
jgi:hypothetical protein